MERNSKDVFEQKTRPGTAHEYAHSVAGEEPPEPSIEETNAYWDRYWDAFYSYKYRQLEEENSSQGERECYDPQGDDLEDPFDSYYRFGGAVPIESTRPTSASDGGVEILSADPFSRTSPSIEDKNRAPRFFRGEEERRQVYEFSRAIAEYLRFSEMKDLVIIDRSSRPLYIGVMEYWKRKFEGVPLPGIYFMNPKGFKSKDLGVEKLESTRMEAFWKEDKSEPIQSVRTKEEITQELKSIYPKLYADRGEPILIFDTCIHSGDTLASILDVMKALGFNNLKIGSVNPSNQESKIKTDFHITNRRPEKGCYPFDRDRIIEKTFEHVYSRPSTDSAKREAAIELRQEIKDIMAEYLNV